MVDDWRTELRQGAVNAALLDGAETPTKTTSCRSLPLPPSFPLTKNPRLAPHRGRAHIGVECSGAKVTAPVGLRGPTKEAHELRESDCGFGMTRLQRLADRANGEAIQAVAT